jgi:hypothetical protein
MAGASSGNASEAWVVSRQSHGHRAADPREARASPRSVEPISTLDRAQRASASARIVWRAFIVHASCSDRHNQRSASAASTIPAFMWRFGRGVAISSVNLEHAP